MLYLQLNSYSTKIIETFFTGIFYKAFFLANLWQSCWPQGESQTSANTTIWFMIGCWLSRFLTKNCFQIWWDYSQTWNLSKKLHRRIFRLKILHRQFHLISTVLVGKNTKNEWKWRNLHHLQKFYTAAGSDGSDKSHFWRTPPAEVEFVTPVTAGGSVKFLPVV